MSISRRAMMTAGVSIGLVLAAAAPAVAAPQIGAPAPAFTAVDSSGRSVSLADLKGKTVVLEWTNDECPFVRKHYGGQAMQALQKKWTGQGVTWLTILSSAPGEQGYADAAKANKLTADRSAAPSAVLLDPKGEVGKAYGAQVTPHMFVIRPDGMLAYMGGIDDKPSTRLEDLKTARNFVDAALTELGEGKPVTTATSRPYGCTVKYPS